MNSSSARRAKDQNRVIGNRSPRDASARKGLIIIYTERSDCVMLMVVAAVERVLACAACNQPAKMKKPHLDSFIALSKSIQITVINDPIYILS
jgi:hypothetical protein